MKLATATMIAILAMAPVARAEEKFSANSLTAGCRTPSTASHYDQGLCTGTVAGLLILVPVIAHAPGERFCPPLQATVGQAMQIAVRYIDARPARWHEM